MRSIGRSSWLVCALLLTGAVLGAQTPQSSPTRDALIRQIDRIFKTSDYAAPRFGPARWLPDGTAYAIVERTPGGSEIARYDVIRVGTDVKEQFENDLKLEMGGVTAYNELVNLAIQLKDNGTHALALEILTESEEHVDWLETQLGLIESVGLQNYLAEQMYEGDEDEG